MGVVATQHFDQLSATSRSGGQLHNQSIHTAPLKSRIRSVLTGRTSGSDPPRATRESWAACKLPAAAFIGTNQVMNSGRSSLLAWNFADPRIVPDDQFTRVASTCLEICGIDCKQPPAADVLAYHSDDSGVGKYLWRLSCDSGGDRRPHAIRLRIGRAGPAIAR